MYFKSIVVLAFGLSFWTPACADMSVPAQFSDTPGFSLMMAAIFSAVSVIAAGIWLVKKRQGLKPITKRVLLSITVICGIAAVTYSSQILPRNFFYKTIAATTAKKFPHAFTATYENREQESGQPPRVYVSREYSDGKGLVVFEQSEPEPSKQIVDLLKHERLVVDFPNKTFNVEKSFAEVPVFDEASALGADWDPLGTDTILGHRCHGYRYSSGGASTWCESRLWLGDDTQCAVTSGGKSRMTESQSQLKSYTTDSPDPSVFLPPPGYKGKR